MKIAFIPIDNRPVCYTLAKDIAEVDGSIELVLPERKLLGDLKKTADIKSLFSWLNNLQDVDCYVISLDTLTYGGLIPSRRSEENFEELLERINALKEIIKGKKVYAFSSIMRISNNNYNEEEKEYWKDYGKKIFNYSYSGGKINDGIPEDILDDYLSTRKRNFEINKRFLEWQREGLFDTLIFSKDDCAEFGFNVNEAKELEKMGGKTKTGADEIPLILLARALDKEIKVYAEYIEPDYKDKISNYEDVSISKSVSGQLEMGGFREVFSKSEADIVLVVNNFIEKQGELVMGWDTKEFDKVFIPPDKPYCVADVRFANGADNSFVEALLQKIDLDKFYGYAGWNTSANSLGSLLAGVKVKWKAKKYNKDAFLKLQMTRFLDDWAYQANVRKKISEPQDIREMMKPYENRLQEVFEYKINSPDYIYPDYIYPWERKFEVEVVFP